MSACLSDQVPAAFECWATPFTMIGLSATGEAESWTSLLSSPLVWVGLIAGLVVAALVLPLIRRIVLAAKPRSD